VKAQYGSRTERYPLAGCQPLALVRLFRRSRPGRHSRRSIQSLRPVCRSFTQPGSSTNAAHGEIFVRFFRAGADLSVRIPRRRMPRSPRPTYASPTYVPSSSMTQVAQRVPSPSGGPACKGPRIFWMHLVQYPWVVSPMAFGTGVCKQCPCGSEGELVRSAEEPSWVDLQIGLMQNPIGLS
jgi:hypothetical protein